MLFLDFVYNRRNQTKKNKFYVPTVNVVADVGYPLRINNGSAKRAAFCFFHFSPGHCAVCLMAPNVVGASAKQTQSSVPFKVSIPKPNVSKKRFKFFPPRSDLINNKVFRIRKLKQGWKMDWWKLERIEDKNFKKVSSKSCYIRSNYFYLIWMIEVFKLHLFQLTF